MDFLIPFFVLGTYKLLFLVWSDLKTLKVDERLSSFMTGVVVLMFFLNGRIIEMLVVVLVTSFLMSRVKQYKQFTGLGAGDLSIMSWVLPGMWFLGLQYLFMFYATFIMFILMNYYLNKKNNGFPATISIAVAFVTTWALEGLGLMVWFSN